MTLKNKLELRTPIKIRELPARDQWVLTLFDCPESGEYEIERKPPGGQTPQRIRFPKHTADQLQLPPEEYRAVQNAIEEYLQETRELEVYADSMEACVGYDSLLRVMRKYFGRRVAYYRSKAGGSLSLEEARNEVYRRNINDQEAMELLDKIMRTPVDFISFFHLLELNDNSPRTAENVWEMIKREARREFESGHRAAEAFEPADYMTDAWNRASYLAIRESFISEWLPKGGMELSMIDAIAQAWLQLQFWTKESVKRAQTEPREEDPQFFNWKKRNKETNAKQWGDGYWDIPYVTEREAIKDAAEMADRWQRMYFRAIRNLRDWRRVMSQVTINNPQQVNIATDGGQQINVSKNDEQGSKKITS